MVGKRDCAFVFLVIFDRVALVHTVRRQRKTKVPFLDKERLEEAVARIRTVKSLRAADTFAPLLVPIVFFDAGGTICSA